MHVLVTGGGGFLGLYLVEQLLAAGHHVRVLCRGQYAALDRLGVSVIQGDLRDAEIVSQACSGIEAVFHAAAIPGISGSWEMFYGINTLGTRHVIAACRQHHVQRLIYTSSPSVVFDGSDHVNANESLPYPRHWTCHYPHSKALAEQEVLAANDCSGLKTVSLRPHLIWGPRDNHLIPRLIQKARAGQLKRVGRGSNEVSVAYVENVAAAHLQAEVALRADRPAAAGRAYFVNEPDPVNLWNWIDELLALAQLPAVQKSVSRRTAWIAGAVCEAVYAVLRLRSDPPMTRFVAAQLAGSHSYSVDAARQDFGYTPVVSMAEAMNRLRPELVRLATK